MPLEIHSGKQLERLVATLERALAGSGARIEASSRRLIDRDTGRSREHDVLIIWDHGHHQIVTAIECRDRSRPVGVPEVEAFADKCAQTGVHSGVIVSARGFRTTAKKKANARSITCMDLAEVPTFDWLGAEAVVRFERRFEHVNAKVMFHDMMPAQLARIRDTEGKEVSTQTLTQIIINSVPASDDPETEVGKEFPVNMRVNTVNWTAEDGLGKVWPIDHVLARTSFTTIRTAHPFKAHSYSGGGKSYEVVSAEAQLGEHSGRFVLMKNDDGTISVMWVREGTEQKGRLR